MDFDQKRRKEAVEYAIRSNKMEGLETSKEAKALLDLVILGELTFEEMRKLIDAKAKIYAERERVEIIKDTLRQSLAICEISGCEFTEEELADFEKVDKGEMTKKDILDKLHTRMRENNFKYYMSLPHTITIKPSLEGGFVASITELPGCITQGDTEEEVLKKIQDAKAAWIDIALQDNNEIPEPTNHGK